ncbi:hypothetical protein GDO81_023141 [Engystomops pustulosus]|uniref:Uncharacterized protein n=1 Tax=Engystomops pustulosus TaxID=76066 RepID=A0AAV6Z7C5_ENGPU|nr:hypothetical protein GDO81_023141 [Engystomops pustulosus]
MQFLSRWLCRHGFLSSYNLYEISFFRHTQSIIIKYFTNSIDNHFHRTVTKNPSIPGGGEEGNGGLCPYSRLQSFSHLSPAVISDTGIYPIIRRVPHVLGL